MLNLDAHLSDLLDLYALAYNRWLRDKLQPKHSDEGCPVPREVTSAQLGRMLLQEALEQRIQRLESYL